MSDHKSDAQALIEHFSKNSGFHRIVDTGECALFAAPDAISLHDATTFIDSARLVPARKSGRTTLLSVDSFVDYVKRHEGENTLVFANEADLSLTAVLDHHRAGVNGEPGFGRFRAVYTMPKSDEWNAWISKNNQQMSQADFAFFLEDRILDVVQASPDAFPSRVQEAIAALNATIAGPSQMMELSRGLSVFSKGEATAHVDVSSGQATIRFEDGHVDSKGKPIKVPNLFVVQIPIARHGAAYLIPVRLRYRIKEGSVVWWYSVWRPDVFIRDAFEDIRKRLIGEEGVGSPVLDGEAPQEAPAR